MGSLLRVLASVFVAEDAAACQELCATCPKGFRMDPPYLKLHPVTNPKARIYCLKS